jgi:hypothetical protein
MVRDAVKMFTIQHQSAEAVPERNALGMSSADRAKPCPWLQVFVKILIYKEMLSGIIKGINYSENKA